METLIRLRGKTPVVAALMLAASALAQAPHDEAGQTGTRSQVPLEIFQGPHVKSLLAPDCDSQSRLSDPTGACAALLGGTEGWVELGFMVDPKGKPFEIAVIRSTGNKAFDAAAAKSVERSTFQPASLDGKPIESGYEFKYVFVNRDMRRIPGATAGFVRDYKALMGAINSGDRAAADAALGKLKVTNLYEDAYFGLGSYQYAVKWGDVSQQLDGLDRAIAEESVAHYLPRDLFLSALLARMNLELQAHEYAELMTTWKSVEKSGVDKATAARIRPIIDKLQKVSSDDSSYEVAGQMLAGCWFLHLFKRHFQVKVSEGFISQVKLRCDKRYVYFNFDPTLQYEIARAYGNCSVEFEGSPGTKFKLIQF